MNSTDPYFNPLALDHLEDPHSRFDRMREEVPVYWHPQIKAWMVSRHADCVRVLRDLAAFSSDRSKIGIELPQSAMSIQTLDPPAHRQLRALLSDALRRQDYRALSARLSELVGDRLEVVKRLPSFDLMEDLARPVALESLFALLGAPTPDVAEFSSLTMAIVGSMDYGFAPERLEPGNRARASLADYVETIMQSAWPDGVLHAVGRALCQADVATNHVFYGSLRGLLVAGYESYSRFLGLAVEALLAVSQLQYFAEQPGNTAIEELLRYSSPVQADSRVCIRDTHLGDVEVRRGDSVVLLLGAANRDPDVFDDPHQLKLHRRPNAHLGFGQGVHKCAGARFSVMNASVVLREISRQSPRLVRASPTTYLTNGTLRGIARLALKEA